MNFLDSSLRVARISGISVRVHVLFLIWIGYQLFTSGGAAGDTALFLGLLFGLVLLHELGHCFGARSVGGHAEDILMWPLGGLAYAHAPMRPWPQFVTVAAGPLVNALLCVASALVILAATGGGMLPGINPLAPEPILLRDTVLRFPGWLHYVYVFYHVNLWLLAFNLLPIYPLDGGQLFQTILWPFVGLNRATQIACTVGLAGSALLGAYALSGGGGGILFVIALFGAFTCWQRLQAASRGLLIEDARFATFGPTHDPRPWWQRILRLGRARRRPTVAGRALNPNPGAWQERQAQREHDEAELDRILKKVSERGIQSLTYVERQRLEQISRQRRAAERQYERGKL